MVSKERIHRKFIEKLARTINGKKGLPDFLRFKVGENSSLEKDLVSDDRIAHVEGRFEFSPDLTLLVTGDGMIDYERNRDRDRSDIKRDFYYFKNYDIVAKVQTTKREYLKALEKFVFPLRVWFENGKSAIKPSYDHSRKDNHFSYGYADMFSQIRSLRHVHVVEDFVRSGAGKALEEAGETLKNKITKLGLADYPIEYETLCCDISGNEDDKFLYTPLAKVQYEDPDTHVGFKITFSPAKTYHPNPKIKSNYEWVVAIPSDLSEAIPQLNTNLPVVYERGMSVTQEVSKFYQKVQDIYNIRFDTPNISDWMDEDIVDMEASHYAVTGTKRLNYILGNEEEFLNCFQRWQNFFRFLKYGNSKGLQSEPLELGPGIFENKT